MSVMSRGVLGLLFWLFVGFGFTEMTVLALNAWVVHGHQGQPADSVAAIKPDQPNYRTITATGVLPKAR
jgi:hypothetical protein